MAVSKCAKGLFMEFFNETSGVKDIFECPSIINRSPVLTLILSRLSTSISLKVPNPLILRYLSFSSAYTTKSKNSFTNNSTFFLGILYLYVNKSIRSCIFNFSFIA